MNIKLATYGVSTTGNMKALLMSLSSILLGRDLPSKILIRMEGEYPSTSEFYLEQLFDLARIKGVSISLTVEESRGIRYARDWLIDNTTTPHLWMGDDDVIYDHECLFTFYQALGQLDQTKLAYINGTKADVNNRRGYRDFSKRVYRAKDAKDGAGYNFIWEGESKLVRSPTCDTGNLFVNVGAIKGSGCRFEYFSHSTNSSGDDTLFSLLCHKAGLEGYFATGARAWHLEKPAVTSFNEFAARKNLVYAQALNIGMKPDEAAEAVKQMLAWEQLREKSV